MRVKKYVAGTEKEAISKIKADLGSDAIILNSRKVRRNGFWGFFGKKNAEVTVAIDDSRLSGNRVEKNETGVFGNQSNKHGENGYDQELEKEKILNTINEVKKHVNQNQGNLNGPSDRPDRSKNYEPGNNGDNFLGNNPGNNPGNSNYGENFNNPVDINPRSELQKDKGSNELHELKEELTQTKSMMQDMLSEFKKIPLEENRLPPVAKKYYNALKNQGVLEELSKDIINNVLSKVTHDQIDNEDNFYNIITTEIKERLNQPVSRAGDQSPEIYTLVGPTGVGKTTTVAKLAARYTLVDKKKVGLITVDTYRIAAVEQLKTYGDILSLPVEVVLTPQELREGIKKFRDKDVILIDTAGRSHRNDMQMSEIKNFIEVSKPSISFLVLSLGTKFDDLQEILNRYSNIRVNGYIFTKIDETSSMGNVLNVVNRTGVGFSYVTMGQDVPDDIETANLNKITRQLLGDG